MDDLTPEDKWCPHGFYDPDPSTWERYMPRLDLRAVQTTEDTTYRGKTWPAGSWRCYDPGTGRTFMMDPAAFARTYMNLTGRHS